MVSSTDGSLSFKRQSWEFHIGCKDQRPPPPHPSLLCSERDNEDDRNLRLTHKKILLASRFSHCLWHFSNKSFNRNFLDESSSPYPFSNWWQSLVSNICAIFHLPLYCKYIDSFRLQITPALKVHFKSNTLVLNGKWSSNNWGILKH